MNDTDQAAENFQISLIRNADPSKRFHAMRSLSETVIRFSKEAIKKASPQLSEEEAGLQFVAHHYGEGLAQKVKTFLEHRRI